MRKPNRGLLAGAVGLAVGATGVGLWRWKRELLGDLEAGSELVTTEEGVVEVARRGSGDPILVLHGTPGGYDQALAVAEPFFDDGYELIAPLGPGISERRSSVTGRRVSRRPCTPHSSTNSTSSLPSSSASRAAGRRRSSSPRTIPTASRASSSRQRSSRPATTERTGSGTGPSMPSSRRDRR
ncbi:hypothetical protein VB779_22625 [Haloarculaceae archaeon H-GB11]|nr:hypothetical protein [Haloarculaceae archaeon H-GB11]